MSGCVCLSFPTARALLQNGRFRVKVGIRLEGSRDIDVYALLDVLRELNLIWYILRIHTVPDARRSAGFVCYNLWRSVIAILCSYSSHLLLWNITCLLWERTLDPIRTAMSFWKAWRRSLRSCVLAAARADIWRVVDNRNWVQHLVWYLKLIWKEFRARV